MNLNLKDVGPIREADIEIADKTVIVGQNSSGKTILAKYAYAIMLTSENFRPVVYIATERDVNYALNFSDYLRPGKYYVLGHEIEFTGDKIIARKNGEVIRNLSYGISTLVPLVLALNSEANTLVIDDPEVGLHIDTLVYIAEELARSKKKMFITTHSEWIPMIIAKFSKMFNYSVKVYEIVNGVAEERKVDEDGYVESFKTIFPKAEEELKKLLAYGENDENEG